MFGGKRVCERDETLAKRGCAEMFGHAPELFCHPHDHVDDKRVRENGSIVYYLYKKIYLIDSNPKQIPDGLSKIISAAYILNAGTILAISYLQ